MDDLTDRPERDFDAPATSAPDPAAILARLALEQARSAGADNTGTRNTIIVLCVFAALLVVGSIFGAVYLRSIAGGDGSNGVSNGSGSAAANLNLALTALKSDLADNGSAAVVTNPEGIATFIRGSDSLALGSASTSSSQIAAYTVTGSAVILTAFQDPTGCFGVLDVLATQPGPVFAAYSQTSDPGVYYFVTPEPSGGVCDVATAVPAAGSHLSSNTFPAAP